MTLPHPCRCAACVSFSLRRALRQKFHGRPLVYDLIVLNAALDLLEDTEPQPICPRGRAIQRLFAAREPTP
jgi:hypothetical protein